MASIRSGFDLEPNALSIAVSRARSRGERILDLTVSNPTRCRLPYDAPGIRRAIADAGILDYDPNPRGLPVARDAVAAYYADHGAEIRSDDVVLTASTSEAYGFLFKTLADPGDDVLVPRPSYPLFEYLAGLEGLRATPYPLAYRDGWSIDLDGLAAAVHGGTRAVVVVSPNNPTGSFLARAELDGLTELCRRRGLALIADEVFLDYPLREEPSRAGTLAAFETVPTYVLSGLSKVAGLPQLKLGWIVVAGPVADRDAALDRLDLVADTYLSVGAPVQLAAPALVAGRGTIRDAVRERIRGNLAAVRDAARGAPFDVLDVEGGWSAVLRVPAVRTGERWALDLLEQDGVLVQPGYFYDFPSEAYLVLALLPERHVFDDGIARLRRRLGGA